MTDRGLAEESALFDKFHSKQTIASASASEAINKSAFASSGHGLMNTQKSLEVTKEFDDNFGVEVASSSQNQSATIQQISQSNILANDQKLTSMNREHRYSLQSITSQNSSEYYFV